MTFIRFLPSGRCHLRLCLFSLVALFATLEFSAADELPDGGSKPAPSHQVVLAEIQSLTSPALIRDLGDAKRAGDPSAGRRFESDAGRAVPTAVATDRAPSLRGSAGGPDPLVYDQVLSHPSFSSTQPGIAARADGTLFAGAVDAIAETIDIYRSNNDGYTWDYVVSFLSSEPASPTLAIGEGNENRLLIAYASDSGGSNASIHVARLDLDTMGVLDAVVHSEAFASLEAPRISVDSPEYTFWYPYVTWGRGVVGRGESYSVQFSRSLDFGETWTPAMTLASGLISGADHDVDFGGAQLNVVYAQSAEPNDRDISIRRSADFGASFDAASAVTTDMRDEYQPRVASTSGGGLSAVVFTKRYSASNTDVEAMVTDDGSSWSLTYLPFSGTEEDLPDVAASVTGDAIHAVYRRFDKFRTSSAYSVLGWTTGREINEGPMDPSFAPAIDASPVRTQEAAVVWTQPTPEGFRVLFDAEYPVGDYLIITANAALESAVASLVAWKEAIGYDVRVISVPTIFESYGSGDDAERIYAYLADQALDVRHVLLVGDVDLLPMRMLYPSDTRPAYGSDFYYASVGTANWDWDVDDRWGEFVDDGFDPHPDLLVGRVPFNDVASVQAFCSNVIAFEQASGSWKRSTLLAHGFMDHVETVPTDPVTDAAYAAERVISDVLTPLGWGSTTLYEKGGISTSSFSCDADLSQANFLTEVGWGKHGLTITNAHGYPGGKAGIQWTSDLNENFIRDLPEEWRYNYFGDWDDIAANPAAGAVCLWGCSTGLPFGDFSGFAASPLRSRYLIRVPRNNLMVKEYLRHGAGTVIASTAGSDYSAGWTDPADGNQQSLSYYFFERLGDGPRRIGDAFFAASVQYANTHGLARGLRVFNVFGDPTLSLDDISLPPGAPRLAAGTETPWVSLASFHGADAAVRRNQDPSLAHHRSALPLVWEDTGELPGGAAILSLTTVGGDLFAGGIASDPSGNRGSIYRSTDEGATWTRHDPSGAVSVRVVEETSSGRLVAGGMGEVSLDPVGVIYTSDDDGASWQQRLSFPEGVVTDLVERASGELFAVTAWNGQVYRSLDDGTTWTDIVDLGEGVGIASIDHLDERLVMALDAPAGLSPVLYSDDGLSWGEAGGLGSAEFAHDVHEAAGVLYCGVRGDDAEGHIYESNDLGETWTIMGSLGDGDVEAVYSVYADAEGNRYAGGSTGWGPAGSYVFRLPAGESDWEVLGGEVDLANHVRAMTLLGSQLFIATGDIYGNVYRLGVGDVSDVPDAPDQPNSPEDPNGRGVHARPNPFSTSTTLRYTLERSGRTEVEVFDARGRRVARLRDRVVQQAGAHEVSWDGTNDQGATVPTGVYYYRVTSSEGAKNGSVVLAR